MLHNTAVTFQLFHLRKNQCPHEDVIPLPIFHSQKALDEMGKHADEDVLSEIYVVVLLPSALHFSD